MSIDPIPAKAPYASALSPEFALLGLLSENPAHGYELHRRLTTHLGQIWHVSLSQTYNILTRLESNGDIKGTVQKQGNLPSRRRYRLTTAGRRRFEWWLRAPTGASVRAIRVEFTTRLFFASSRDPALAKALIDAQTAETQKGVVRLKATLSQLPPDQTFNRQGLDLRIRQLASILEWLDGFRTSLQLNH